MTQYLGIDIGGTEIKYGLVDSEGVLGEMLSCETPQESLESFVEAIGEIYDAFAEQVEGMAISMPGIIHSKTGYAVHGGSLDYISNLNMVELLETRCPTTIHLENDGKAAALGELWKGELSGIQHGVIIVLGTGIGGGIIANGQLLKGSHYSAAEFSFIKTNVEKSEDPDYMFGYQNGLKMLIKKVSEKCGLSIEELDGYKIFDLAAEENPGVLECLNDYCYSLAIQIFNLQTILDPEKIVISGGVSEAPLMIKLIQSNVKKVFTERNTDLFFRPKVVKSKFGNKANIIGALYNYKLNEDLVI